MYIYVYDVDNLFKSVTKLESNVQCVILFCFPERHIFYGPSFVQISIVHLSVTKQSKLRKFHNLIRFLENV